MKRRPAVVRRARRIGVLLLLLFVGLPAASASADVGGFGYRCSSGPAGKVCGELIVGSNATLYGRMGIQTPAGSTICSYYMIIESSPDGVSWTGMSYNYVKQCANGGWTSLSGNCNVTGACIPIPLSCIHLRLHLTYLVNRKFSNGFTTFPKPFACT